MLVVLMATAGILVFLPGRQSSAAETALPTLADGDGRATFTMAVDTPPRPMQASGWPFRQLPLVAKFGVPVPRVGVVAVAPPAFQRVLIPAPPAPTLPPVAGPPAAGPPLWLLTPLAAGAFVGGSSATVPATVIPEPGTLLLLSTGLVLVAVHARRRKHRHDA